MPTKKCEICGDEVQNLQFKKHMAAHSESKPEEKKEDVVTTKPIESKTQDKQTVDPEVASLMKQALAAEAKMLEAPDMFFSEDSADQHGSLVRVHCPESLGENPEWEAVFGDGRKRIEGYAAKGYRPIFDDKGGMVTDDQGNPMFKVRKEIIEGRRDVYRKESSDKLNRATEIGKEKNPNAKFSEEELTITKNNGD
jgi:hypothetical protein